MKTKIDWKQYEKRVAELENEGLCRSDAQSVADVEFAEASTPRRRSSEATPGPWTASGCTVYAGDMMLGCTYCEGNRELNPIIFPSDTLPDSTGIHGSGWDEAGANARLIAAAPDLLDALRRLTHPMASDDDLSHALALIEKLEGRVA